MPRSRGRRKITVPARARQSWFHRLPPELRIGGMVLAIFVLLVAFLAWPRPERTPQELVVVVPWDSPIASSLREVRPQFMRAHPDINLLLLDARDAKMSAYEAQWRKGESRVDLLIGTEQYLARWSRARLLQPWDRFLSSGDTQLARAGLSGGRLAGRQELLPLALELTCIKFAIPSNPSPLLSLEDLSSRARRMSAPDQPALGADWEGQWAPAVLLATAQAAGAQPTPAMLLGRTKEALAWWRRGIAARWALGPGARVQDSPPLLWAGQRGWNCGDSKTTGLWLPPGAAQRGTVCVVHGALLPRATKRKEAVYRLARELLLSEQFQLALARRTGLLPAAVSAWRQLEGRQWKTLTAAAARSFPLPPELRSRKTAQRFAQITRECLEGKLSAEAAAIELRKLGGAAPATE